MMLLRKKYRGMFIVTRREIELVEDMYRIMKEIVETLKDQDKRIRNLEGVDKTGWWTDKRDINDFK